MSKHEDAGEVKRVFVTSGFRVIRGISWIVVSEPKQNDPRITRNTRMTKNGPSSLLFSFGGFLEFCDVELLHFHHRLHHPLCFRFVSTLKYLQNNIRNDLPEKTELVL